MNTPKNLLTPLVLLTLLLATSLLFTACGDDGGSESEDDMVTDTTTDADEDGTADVPDDSDEDAPNDTDEDGTTGFQWPDSPQDYMGGQTAYLNTLSIPEIVQDQGPACCKDFGPISRDNITNGTDRLDNALAQLNSLLGPFDLDLGAVMNENIQDGTLVLLWDHQAFDGADDTDFLIAALLGEWANGTDFQTANNGQGEFNVFESAFVPGTGEPLVVFDDPVLENGRLSAGPADFNLSVQLVAIFLDATIAEAEINGQITVDESGVTYAQGTISGYLTLEDIAEIFNDFLLSDSCACLQISEPVYELNPDGSINANCVEDAHTLCDTEDNSVCATIADSTDTGTPVCSVLPDIVGGIADLDLNGDCATDPDNCVYEGVSVGLEWTAVPGTIVGVTP